MSLIGWLIPTVDPGQLVQARIELSQEVRLGLALRPGVVGRQPDRSLDVRGRPGIDGGILAAELGDDIGDLRKFADGAPQFARHFAGGIERKAARQLDLEPERALVQIRQVVATDQTCREPLPRRRPTPAARYDKNGPVEQAAQRRTVGAPQPFERPVAE